MDRQHSYRLLGTTALVTAFGFMPLIDANAQVVGDKCTGGTIVAEVSTSSSAGDPYDPWNGRGPGTNSSTGNPNDSSINCVEHTLTMHSEYGVYNYTMETYKYFQGSTGVTGSRIENVNNFDQYFEDATYTPLPSTGNATDTRTVQCKDNSGNVVADSYCSGAGAKPDTTKVGASCGCVHSDDQSTWTQGGEHNSGPNGQCAIDYYDNCGAFMRTENINSNSCT